MCKTAGLAGAISCYACTSLTGMYNVLFFPFITVVKEGDFIKLKRNSKFTDQPNHCS